MSKTRCVAIRTAGFALLLVVFGAAFIVALTSCAASAAKPKIELGDMLGGREANAPASRPASQPAEQTIDVQQLAGQVVAGVKADLRSEVRAEVNAAVTAAVNSQVRLDTTATGVGGNATGYQSEFGIGAASIVGATLVLTLILSHLRDMARIKSQAQK